jgi:phosphoribosylaminoimidazole-succinocarboxamide synthase
MPNSLAEIKITGQKGEPYFGKVRNVYTTHDGYLVLITTDRISAFDQVLPREIPGKGAILNHIASEALHLAGFDTSHEILPWLISNPHQNVSIGYRATPFPVEMVIRGYLVGHAAREYSKGKRILCGASMPNGMKENSKFPEPIITPTTKAHIGHDEDISEEEIIERGLVSAKDYSLLKSYTRTLFDLGTEYAKNKGLILADTKYEFGKLESGEIMIIDEVHTPDSSRYFYIDGYEQLQSKGLQQKQLSKEFVREWLIANNFMGKNGQVVPEMTDEKVNEISSRYTELYTQCMGYAPKIEWFKPLDPKKIEEAINEELAFLRKKA